MRTRVSVVMMVLVVLMASVAMASDVTVMPRVDVRDGEAYDNLLFCQPDGIQVWLYNLNDHNALDYEVGYGEMVLKDSKQSLQVVGALAWYPNQEKLYLEPFANYTREVGEARLRVRALYYQPLTDGAAGNLIIDEVSLTVPVTPNLRLGPAYRYCDKEGADPTRGAGAIAEWKLGRAIATVRYTGGELPVLRMQVGGTIKW